MLSVSAHFNQHDIDFELSKEKVTKHDGSIYRVLLVKDKYGISKFAMFITTEQAKQLADTICSQLEAEKEAGAA